MSWMTPQTPRRTERTYSILVSPCHIYTVGVATGIRLTENRSEIATCGLHTASHVLPPLLASSIQRLASSV